MRAPGEGLESEFNATEKRGVVRYDSASSSPAALDALPDSVQARIERAQGGDPQRRVVVTQIAPLPGDGVAERRALIEAQHGLRLVVGGE